MQTYNVKEIADMLNTNPETVRRWIRSGKLEAVQGSRKGGNVVTEAMLNAFLKSSPKYAGAAVTLLATPVGITAATATLVGGILAQQFIKNEKAQHAQVKPEEIKKLLKANINTSREAIKRKMEATQQLQAEIDSEQKHIDEAKRLIEELDTRIEAARNSVKGEKSNE